MLLAAAVLLLAPRWAAGDTNAPPVSAKELLAKAPVIEWEDLGVMVRGRATLTGTPGLGLSTDKDGWSAYAAYRDHVVKRKPWEICEINLQTLAVKHFPAAGEELSDTWGFVVFPDGRPYTFPTGGAHPGARIARVDWKSGQLQVFGPCPDGWNYDWQWDAVENAVYIGGYREGYAVRFDPESGEIVNYGRQGPPGAGPAMSVAADSNYVYSCVGRNTSYLVACDRKTKAQRILGELRYPERWMLNAYDGQVFPRAWTPASAGGAPEWKDYRVKDGKLDPIEKLPGRRSATDRREAFGVPRPEILPGSARCMGDGHAVVWHRKAGGEWREARFLVDDEPSYLFRMGLAPGGKIIGSSEDPYTIFTFDPRTGAKELLGPPPNDTHVYDFYSHPNGKIYMCGYSGAPLFAWDPAKPWNCQPPTPESPMLDWKSPKLNPLQVARMYRQRRAYASIGAADGRLYIPCSAYVETIPGGGLGWYDPEKNEAGIIREGFEAAHGNDACAAGGGRYVVVTTAPWPEAPPAGNEYILTDPHDLAGAKAGLAIRYRGPDGETGKPLTPDEEVKRILGGKTSRKIPYDDNNYVLTYDTQSQSVIGRIAIGKRTGNTMNANGQVCEWKPGLVVVRADTGTNSYFWLLDVKEQKLSRKIELPSAHGRTRLLRVPDGRIASLHLNAIVLVDPFDWTWEAAGRLRPLKKGTDLVPRDWLMAGGDLYLYCDTRLGRIRGFAAAKHAAPSAQD